MMMSPSGLRGMGQVNPCPSLEQMAGIVDPSDPCQAANTSGQAIPGTIVPTASAGITANMTNLLLLAGAALVVILIAKR